MSIVGMATGAAGCCHLNRLPELTRPLDRIELVLRVEEAPTVHFTHQSLATFRRPGPVHGHAEIRYGQVLEALGPDALTAGLFEQAPGVLRERLGWQLASGRQEADATLVLTVEDYCFCALDAISETEIKWKVRASITGTDGDRVMWRACPEWTTGPLGETMEGLARQAPEQHRRLIGEAARRLLVDLAAAIKRDRAPGHSDTPDGRNET